MTLTFFAKPLLIENIFELTLNVIDPKLDIILIIFPSDIPLDINFFVKSGSQLISIILAISPDFS